MEPRISSWETEAQNWIRWTRTPGHDVFPYFAPTFFEEIVPPYAGRTLEIGCGEGRVARELSSSGHSVVAVDASPTLVRHAREADRSSAYLVADATALPFADDMFETVVAYNSLQSMAGLEDMAKAVREAGRVVKERGHLCICVAHPMTDGGRVKERTAEGDLVISGSYFENLCVNDAVTRDGLQMTFHGWVYTLEDYMRALEEGGFAVERAREPVPRVEPGATGPRLAEWQRIPMFVFIRAVKRGG